MRGHPRLSVIKMANINAPSDPSTISALRGLIVHNPRIASFDFHHNYLHHEALCRFFISFRESRELLITRLDLDSMGVGSVSIKDLVSTIVRCPQITFLSLRKNAIGGTPLTLLLRGLHRKSSLVSLNLARAKLRGADLKTIGDFLLDPSTALRELDISDNRLGSDAMDAIATYWNRNKSLATLWLGQNSFSPSDISRFVAFVNGLNQFRKEYPLMDGQETAYLSVLDLSDMRILKDRAQAFEISQLISSSSVGITRLILVNVGLTQESSRVLATGIRKSASIEYVDIRIGEISADVAHDLAVHYVTSPTLSRILMDYPDNKKFFKTKNLQGKNLVEIPASILRATHLTKLNLRDTRLRSIPEDLTKLKDLTSLDLRQNLLEFLPSQMGWMTNLKKLKLDGNPLRTPPAELRASAGDKPNKILGYLRDLSAGHEMIYRAKLMLVGQENVGKTTILALLRRKLKSVKGAKSPKFGRGPNHPPTGPSTLVRSKSGKLEQFLSTDGIDIHELQLEASMPVRREYKPDLFKRSSKCQTPGSLSLSFQSGNTSSHGMSSSQSRSHVPSSSSGGKGSSSSAASSETAYEKRTVTLSTWDFGGQEIYYATHQFFLSDQSVFLVVWDLRYEEEDSRVGFWLQSIRARARSPYVIIVGTHADEASGDPSWTRPTSANASSDPIMQRLHAVRQKYRSYPMVRGVVAVNCVVGDISELISQITSALQELPGMGVPIPSSHLALSRFLRQYREATVAQRLELLSSHVSPPSETSSVAPIASPAGSSSSTPMQSPRSVGSPSPTGQLNALTGLPSTQSPRSPGAGQIPLSVGSSSSLAHSSGPRRSSSQGFMSSASPNTAPLAFVGAGGSNSSLSLSGSPNTSSGAFGSGSNSSLPLSARQDRMVNGVSYASYTKFFHSTPTSQTAAPKMHANMFAEASVSQSLPYKTWSEFAQLARFCNIADGPDLKRCVETLNMMGDVIYFDDPKGGLDDLVILDSQFLTQIMATLITTKQNYVKNGVLNLNDLRYIWTPKMFPIAIHPLLIALLQKFEILFIADEELTKRLVDYFDVSAAVKNPSYPIGGIGVIPSLLPEAVPSLDILWPPFAEPLVQYDRQYVFELVPSGLFSRLLVRLLQSATDILHCWRYGAVLLFSDSLCLVELNNRRQCISVNLRGGRSPTEQLRTIADVVEALILVDTWWTTPVKRRISCPACLANLHARFTHHGSAAVGSGTFQSHTNIVSPGGSADDVTACMTTAAHGHKGGGSTDSLRSVQSRGSSGEMPIPAPVPYHPSPGNTSDLRAEKDAHRTRSTSNSPASKREGNHPQQQQHSPEQAAGPSTADISAAPAFRRGSSFNLRTPAATFDATSSNTTAGTPTKLKRRSQRVSDRERQTEEIPSTPGSPSIGGTRPGSAHIDLITSSAPAAPTGHRGPSPSANSSSNTSSTNINAASTSSGALGGGSSNTQQHQHSDSIVKARRPPSIGQIRMATKEKSTSSRNMNPLASPSVPNSVRSNNDFFGGSASSFGASSAATSSSENLLWGSAASMEIEPCYFILEECAYLASLNESFIECESGHVVRLDRVAPDLALSDLEAFRVKPTELELDPVPFAKGSYALLHKALWTHDLYTSSSSTHRSPRTSRRHRTAPSPPLSPAVSARAISAERTPRSARVASGTAQSSPTASPSMNNNRRKRRESGSVASTSAKDYETSPREKDGDNASVTSNNTNSSSSEDMGERTSRYSKVVTELVAVKVLQGIEVENAKLYDEFAREVWTMSGLNHPNLVNLLGYYVDTAPAMVMEFVDGGDLYSFLHEQDEKLKPEEQPPRLPNALVLKIALDIANGMNFLHSATPPLIHRDLKTPNIMLTNQKNDPSADIVAKVADFGLVNRMVIPAFKEGRLQRAVSNPTWQAPEILREEEFTQQSDIYAYGLILWELYTRRHPYSNRGPPQFLYEIEDQILARERPPIPSDCPPEFERLIRACWANDPNERPSFPIIIDEIYSMIEKSGLSAVIKASPVHRRTKRSGSPGGSVIAPPSMHQSSTSSTHHATSNTTISSGSSPTSGGSALSNITSSGSPSSKKRSKRSDSGSSANSTSSKHSGSRSKHSPTVGRAKSFRVPPKIDEAFSLEHESALADDADSEASAKGQTDEFENVVEEDSILANRKASSAFLLEPPTVASVARIRRENAKALNDDEDDSEVDLSFDDETTSVSSLSPSEASNPAKKSTKGIENVSSAQDDFSGRNSPTKKLKTVFLRPGGSSSSSATPSFTSKTVSAESGGSSGGGSASGTFDSSEAPSINLESESGSPTTASSLNSQASYSPMRRRPDSLRKIPPALSYEEDEEDEIARSSLTNTTVDDTTNMTEMSSDRSPVSRNRLNTESGTSGSPAFSSSEEDELSPLQNSDSSSPSYSTSSSSGDEEFLRLHPAMATEISVLGGRLTKSLQTTPSTRLTTIMQVGTSQMWGTGKDGSVHVWNAKNGALIATQPGAHKGMISAAAPVLDTVWMSCPKTSTLGVWHVKMIDEGHRVEKRSGTLKVGQLTSFTSSSSSNASNAAGSSANTNNGNGGAKISHWRTRFVVINFKDGSLKLFPAVSETKDASYSFDAPTPTSAPIKELSLINTSTNHVSFGLGLEHNQRSFKITCNGNTLFFELESEHDMIEWLDCISSIASGERLMCLTQFTNEWTHNIGVIHVPSVKGELLITGSTDSDMMVVTWNVQSKMVVRSTKLSDYIASGKGNEDNFDDLGATEKSETREKSEKFEKSTEKSSKAKRSSSESSSLSNLIPKKRSPSSEHGTPPAGISSTSAGGKHNKRMPSERSLVSSPSKQMRISSIVTVPKLGHILVAAGPVIFVLNPKTLDVIEILRAPVSVFGSTRASQAPILCMALTGPKEVWAATKNGTIIVWNTSTFQLIASFQAPPESRIRCIMPVSASSVWTAGDDGIIRIWNSATRALQTQLPAQHSASIRVMTMWHHSVWSASFDKTVCIWT